MSKPGCGAANCGLVAQQRGFCTTHYKRIQARQREIEAAGTLSDRAWEEAINEAKGRRRPLDIDAQSVALRAALGLPADSDDPFGELVLKVSDLRKEAREVPGLRNSLAAQKARAEKAEAAPKTPSEEYTNLLEESTELCAIMGGDGDLVDAVRALKARAAEALRVLDQMAGQLGDGDEGQVDITEIPDRLSAMRSAHRTQLDEMSKLLEERRREVETLGRMSADWRAQFEAEEQKHAGTFGSLTAEADKVRDLEAKLAAVNATPAPDIGARLEWTGDTLDLCLGQFRAPMAVVYDEGSEAIIYRWAGSEPIRVPTQGPREAAAVIIALLGLRGITVPPYPVTE